MLTPDPSEITQLVRSLPPWTAYPTVDELDAALTDLVERHAGLVDSSVVGTSRGGEPIRCLTVGEGRHRQVVVGGVHPNEPVGSITVVELVRLLVADADLRRRLDTTWSIIGCLDPDGMRLNEGWFARPTDRVAMLRGFYRPPPHEQVEWAFPWAYRDGGFDRVLPETRALMRVIDRTRPDLLMTLHNSEAGGAYFYLSREEPGLPEELRGLARGLGLPLHTGEPEAAHLPTYGPAVFGAPAIEETYDHLAALGVDPAEVLAGASGSDYARSHGTLTVVAEAPQWSSAYADDDRPAEETYPDVLRRRALALLDLADRLSDVLERARPHLHLDTPHRRAAAAFVPLIRADAEAELARSDRVRADHQHARPATLAEETSCRDLVHCFRLRYGGTLLQALRHEATAAPGSPVSALVEELTATLAGWEAEARPVMDGVLDPVPPERLAGLQLSTLLLANAHVRRAM